MEKGLDIYSKTWDSAILICSEIADTLVERGRAIDDLRALNDHLCAFLCAEKSKLAFWYITALYIYLNGENEFVFNTVADNPVLIMMFVDEFTQIMNDIIEEYELRFANKKRKKGKKWQIVQVVK